MVDNFLNCATQAAQGAVRLEGDVITANGSILSGQLPREQGGLGGAGGLAGSLIHLEGDSKSVCSCSCQVISGRIAHGSKYVRKDLSGTYWTCLDQAAGIRCFPCFAWNNRRLSGPTGRPGRPKRHKVPSVIEYPPFVGGSSVVSAVPALTASGPGPRSYGALSSTGTYSMGSLTNDDDEEDHRHHRRGAGNVAYLEQRFEPQPGSSGEYYELQGSGGESMSRPLRSGVIYASSTRSSIVTTASPSRGLYPGGAARSHHRTESPTPDRVLTRSRRHHHGSGGSFFTLAGLIRRLRQFRRRIVGSLHMGHRPNARQR